MLKVEALFPEVANLYGDTYQMELIRQSVPDAQIISTGLKDRPAFASGDVDFLYMGPSSEEGLELAAAALKPYRERLKELIDKGTVCLFTGNSFEILEEYTEVAEEVPGKDGEGRRIEGLGLFPFHAVRRMMHRYNTLYWGTFEDTDKATRDLIGFKTEFSYTYGDNSQCFAFQGKRGFGLNPDTAQEGIRVKNFLGTYLNGPVMINNPYFAKYLLKLAGVENPHLAFEEDMFKAYRQKLARFQDPSCVYSID